jgi:AAA domain-containing protein
MQLSGEEKLVAQAGARGAPAMTREEAARALGAEPAELEAPLHEPPGAEVNTTACGLRTDQAAAAFHVLTSDRRVEVIVGPAGAGKTRVLAEIGKAWPGGRVVGVAPSQSARDVLAAAGVAESHNFARFLGHLKDRRGALGPVELARGDLIVIDEASMLSNLDLADIVDYAARTGVKVAMALDHQQLQAVENGGGASLITLGERYSAQAAINKCHIQHPARHESGGMAAVGMRAGLHRCR